MTKSPQNKRQIYFNSPIMKDRPVICASSLDVDQSLFVRQIFCFSLSAQYFVSENLYLQHIFASTPIDVVHQSLSMIITWKDICVSLPACKAFENQALRVFGSEQTSTCYPADHSWAIASNANTISDWSPVTIGCMIVSLWGIWHFLCYFWFKHLGESGLLDLFMNWLIYLTLISFHGLPGPTTILICDRLRDVWNNPCNFKGYIVKPIEMFGVSCG